MICLDRSAAKLSFLVLASFLLQVVPVPGQDLVWARQMGGPPPKVTFLGLLGCGRPAWRWTAAAMSTRRGISRVPSVPSTSTQAPATST